MFKLDRLVLFLVAVVMLGALALPAGVPQQVEAGRGTPGVVINPTYLYTPMQAVPLAVGTVLDLLTYYPARAQWWACVVVQGRLCGYVAAADVSY